MKNTTQQTILDYSDLIGTPYTEKDCWGIVREYYSRLGIELKKFYDVKPESREKSSTLITLFRGQFVKVNQPLPNDIFTARILGVECHVGIYLGRGKILHTLENHNCVVDSQEKWKHRIVGFYRVIE